MDVREPALKAAAMEVSCANTMFLEHIICRFRLLIHCIETPLIIMQ